MALYEYECTRNGHRFEVRHGMTERPVYACLECRGNVRRVISAPGIVFKGRGFYATDSRTSSDAANESKPPSVGGEARPTPVSAKTSVRETSGDVKAGS